MLLLPKDKNALFDTFRYFASSLDDARYGYQPVDSSNLLRSIKMVGPEFSYPDYFSMDDESFLLSVISMIKHARIPLSAEFSGTFDSLKENCNFPASDFLLSQDSADILTINYVIGLPNNYEHSNSSAFAGAVAIKELSERHFDPDAWKKAAESHKAKIVFVMGGDSEISASHLLGEKYTYLASFDRAGKTCSIAIDRDYLGQLQKIQLNPNSLLGKAANSNSHSIIRPAA